MSSDVPAFEVHVHDLNLTYNKKSFSDHAIRTSGPILWNSLPKTLKDSKTIGHFRSNLKQKLKFKIMFNLDF